MRRSSLSVCAFLFVVCVAENQENSTNDNEWNDTVRSKSHIHSTTTKDYADLLLYKLHENFTRHDSDREDNSTRYEFHNDSSRNDNESLPHEFRSYSDELHKVGNLDKPLELRVNSTKVAGESKNSTFLELSPEIISKSDNYENVNETSLLYKMCNNTVCIPICCEIGQRWGGNKCIPKEGSQPSFFPEVYEFNSSQSDKRVDELFQLVVYDPCDGMDRFILDPSMYPDDEYVFLMNGSLYTPRKNNFLNPTNYCLTTLKSDKYQVALCFPNKNETTTPSIGDYEGVPVGLVISLPFLLATFVVYTILPELWNMHGHTLRGYVGSLFIAYTLLAILQLSTIEMISESFCITLAFTIYFSFLASFFWLNVMCFDIWWTFGGFRSLHGSVKQREKKKFIMYSIYAWGSASIFTIICAIMNFVPSVPKEFIRPEFGIEGCWFTTEEAKAVYFYGPMSVTVICNIYLFISTAMKIIRHKKDTAHHLRGSESRRHDENKQRFNLYLKLFIVMGINWSMEIVSWLVKSAPKYIWYLTDLTNSLQGLIIFIIFVWKDKIKRLLLKRFGCQDRNLFSGNSTRSGYHSSASRTCTTTTGVIPLQEKINPNETNCHTKNSSETNLP